MFDACLVSIEKGQKLSIRWFLLIFLILLLLCILLTSLIFLSLFSLSQLALGSLDLHAKISNFLLIPIDGHRYMVTTKIISHEVISVDIIDVEAVVDSETSAGGGIGDNPYFTTIGVNGAVTDVTD
jgi:hypothetical protein